MDSLVERFRQLKSRVDKGYDLKCKDAEFLLAVLNDDRQRLEVLRTVLGDVTKRAMMPYSVAVDVSQAVEFTNKPFLAHTKYGRKEE